MILISHRGNITGKKESLENTTSYIEEALHLGFEVEIDLWKQSNKFFLGHDFPQYEIQYDWLLEKKLWIHCKNQEAIEYFNTFDNNFIFFWHEHDTITFTNKGHMICKAGYYLDKSIIVLPELLKIDYSKALGVISDEVHLLKKNF